MLPLLTPLFFRESLAPNRSTRPHRHPYALALSAPFLRIIDANLNRAREACRVLDDLCRFVLDDAPLCQRWKSHRHAIVLAAQAFNPTDLLRSRNTEGDIGREVTTPSEFRRESARTVAQAATGRLSEALRSLEEASKALAALTAAAAFEALRYETYTLEQDTLARFPPAPLPHAPLPHARQWNLCVLITESLCTLPWTETLVQAIEGGADCIQLREKNIDSGPLLERCHTARALTHARGCALIINDRPDLAAASKADGVHLGQTDLPPATVRALFGPTLLIGVSTTNLDEARSAVADHADSCGLGPMFPTTTKLKPTLAGPAYAAAYLADPTLAATPHLAIGGITQGNIHHLRTVGVRGVAVSAIVCESKSPASTCRQLRDQLGV